MKTITFALLMGFLISQESVPPPVAAEIRKLRADDVAERDDATRKLMTMGEEARPALQGLLQDGDVEVRSRVTDLVRELDRLARVRALGAPARRVTIDLKDARLDDALRRVFEPFGIKAGVQGGLGHARPVTLWLKDASFWEAMDVVYAASDCFGQNVPVKKAGDAPGELQFTGPWVPGRNTATHVNVGDFRVIALPSTVTGPGHPGGSVSALLMLWCAPWAAPKSGKILDVRIAGQRVRSQEELTGFGFEREGIPRTNECLKLLDQWKASNGVPRASFQPAETLNVEGTLLLTYFTARGDEQVRLLFTIDAMPVPAK